MLGVPEELIRKYGAVSESVALAMAEGAIEKSGVWRSVSITGFAGPDEETVPVGKVWIGFAGRDCESRAKEYSFGGNRNEIRRAAAAAALEELLGMILTLDVISNSI
jgi:PncC family amidohydrolase